MQGGRHLARGHRGQVVALPKLDKSESSENVKYFITKLNKMSPSVCGVADARVVIEENADRSVGELEAEPVLVAVVDPLRDEERPLLDEVEAGL